MVYDQMPIVPFRISTVAKRMYNNIVNSVPQTVQETSHETVTEAADDFEVFQTSHETATDAVVLRIRLPIVHSLAAACSAPGTPSGFPPHVL